MSRYPHKKQYGNRHYSYSGHYEHTFHSYSDESMTFVKQRFFTLDTNAFQRMSIEYHRQYGQKAFEYLNEAYTLWKNGKRRISDQTIGRILRFVPKYISYEDRYELLYLELKRLHDKLLEQYSQTKITTREELFARYTGAIEKVNLIRNDDVRWFVSDVFSSKETDEYADAIRHMVRCKLKNDYTSVCADIKQIRSSEIAKVCERTIYTCGTFRDTIDISAFADSEDIRSIDLQKSPEIVLSNITAFESIWNKLLVEYRDVALRERTGELSGEELTQVKKIVESAKREDKEILLTSTLRGNGGLLELRHHRMSRRSAVTRFRIEFLCFTIIAVAYGIAVSNIIRTDSTSYSGWSVLLLIGSLAIFYNSIKYVIECYKLIPKKDNHGVS